MPADDFCQLLLYAADQEEETKLWQRWIVAAQHISFEEFKQSLKPKRFKPEKVLLADEAHIMRGVVHGNI